MLKSKYKYKLDEICLYGSIVFMNIAIVNFIIGQVTFSGLTGLNGAILGILFLCYEIYCFINTKKSSYYMKCDNNRYIVYSPTGIVVRDFGEGEESKYDAVAFCKDLNEDLKNPSLRNELIS